MKWLLTWRQYLGLTQVQLGDRAGIDSNMISRYERNTATPSLENIKRLALGLGITVDELLNGPESERPKVTLSYDWKKFEEGDVDMTGMGYDIFLGADGVVGIKGSMLLKSKEAIKSFIAEIEEQLTIGYEAQERRGAIKETKHD